MKNFEELTTEELRDFRDATYMAIDTAEHYLLEEHLRDLYEKLAEEASKRCY
ncbi:hypothetical protein V2151_28920 [Bacillus cereus]|uniref:hypothetical protein n=1 Tax=Bacillus cereus TaxID=1396 RepID=UPI000279AE8D|nr:hypothetical protein [Bacillus cereus]EJR71389.1 hypothetical protein IK9_06040 [Bacillus cereus VD166]